VYLVFETSDIPTTRTSIYRNHQELVALFDWMPGNQFGRAVIGSRQIPMNHLVMHGTTPNSRMFLTAEGKRYEWRRLPQDPSSYELYFLTTHTRIAVFRRIAQMTPIGPSHGMLRYTFNHDILLLESLLALCLNRCLDWQTT